MSASIINKAMLIMKTGIAVALLGATLAVTAPVFGVTEPPPVVAQAEQATPSGVWGWIKTRPAVVKTAAAEAVNNVLDPEKQNEAIRADRDALRVLNQELKAKLAVQRTGNMVQIDDLRTCTQQTMDFLSTFEPE